MCLVRGAIPKGAVVGAEGRTETQAGPVRWHSGEHALRGAWRATGSEGGATRGREHHSQEHHSQEPLSRPHVARARGGEAP